MKEGQKEIFVIAGESTKVISGSPFLQHFTQQGLEVLYMTDPIDEYLLSDLAHDGYDGKKFVDITRAEAAPGDAGDAAKKGSSEEAKKDHEGVCSLIKRILGEEAVESVEVSRRVAGAPCALAAPSFGVTANMERILKAQALQTAEQRLASQLPGQRRKLLINPDHDIIASLRR